MSGNMESDRSVTAGKMYPIDLAPQKITIVKNVSNAEVKMTQLLPGQSKSTSAGQIISHTGSVGLMRPASQILSPSVSAQMIVSGPQLLQGTQIVNQGSQIITSSQIISQSQISIKPGTQLLSPGTQIISQGTQLSAQVQSANVTTGSNVQVSLPSSVSGQVLSVGGLVSGSHGQLVSGTQGQIVSGAANLVVSSAVRSLPPCVRVLPPLQSNNNKGGMQLSTVNVSSASACGMSMGVGGVVVSKAAMNSHVPRGLAAGASLAVRPATATPNTVNAGASWGASRGRGGLLYARAPAPLPRTLPTAPNPNPNAALITHTTIVTQPMPTATVLTSTSSALSGVLRAAAPLRAGTPTAPAVTPRPLPLLQRNYQPAKVMGVANVGVRGVVGNSAPTQLYYEVPRAAPAPAPSPLQPQTQPPPQPQSQPQPPPTPVRPLAPYSHTHAHAHTHNVAGAVSVVSVATTERALPAVIPPRPTILRKREGDGSPTKAVGNAYVRCDTGWDDVRSGGGGGGGGSGSGSGGSTTVSAASSPAPDDDTEDLRTENASPRKKSRKQTTPSTEVRQYQQLQADEAPPSPPPLTIHPPPKRPQLSSSYVCGWRGTALHFARPADVKRREPRAADIIAIASQKHVLNSADGWKVHHLTAQMDDLMSLESDAGSQLSNVLRTLEGASSRALSALQPHSHTLMELLKGNIQRSKIVCEGIQEARDDILRVFTHRTFVSDILSRQADKRCFRKHRSQS